MVENPEIGSVWKIEEGVSLILPCHNEAENIQAVIEEAKEVFGEIAQLYEIIIVDDGSSDLTPELVRNLIRTDPRLRLIQHQSNLGYGRALRTGFENAHFPWIFFTDGDGQFRIAELKKFIPYLEKSKMVVGYRASRADPVHRRIYGRIFSWLINFLFGLKIKDVNCAFKILAKEIIEGEKLISPGALINAELFILAKRKGIEPIQLAVSHFPRKAGSQSGGSPQVIVRAFWELLQLYFRMK